MFQDLVLIRFEKRRGLQDHPRGHARARKAFEGDEGGGTRWEDVYVRCVKHNLVLVRSLTRHTEKVGCGNSNNNLSYCGYKLVELKWIGAME
jgi:hypothetical protein